MLVKFEKYVFAKMSRFEEKLQRLIDTTFLMSKKQENFHQNT
jgi:hypothetical protein